ncbi:MAG TPA: chemotaxis protein CheW [Bacteroidales bacterium]|nr:chemotaxis protein CheW [Bacteroidales bacterium]
MEKQTLLTFSIDKEFFAVDVVHVLEVLERQHVTRVPQTPRHILGITNFRGEILPVIDMRCKFNLPPLEHQDKNFIIIYDIGADKKNFTIAATADTVKDVIEVASNDIKSVPEMGINYDSKYISGVIRREDHFILLLNVEKIFQLTDVISIEETVQSSEI